jgi:alkylated DNA repair dioxygenase AlkB
MTHTIKRVFATAGNCAAVNPVVGVASCKECFNCGRCENTYDTIDERIVCATLDDYHCVCNKEYDFLKDCLCEFPRNVNGGLVIQQKYMTDRCPVHKPAKATLPPQATDQYHEWWRRDIAERDEQLAAEKRAKPQGLLYAPTTGINGTPIIEALDAMEWKSVWGTKNSRRTQHFGSTYDYKRRKVGTDAPPMPDFMTPLIKHLEKFCAEQNTPCQFNQCIVNDYQVGQGINKHIDIKAYGAVIGCYTFGSGATMIFRKDGEKHELYVNPDSLYVMSGDVRNAWTHEMAGRKTDKVDGVKINRGRRVSITFRYVPE